MHLNMAPAARRCILIMCGYLGFAYAPLAWSATAPTPAIGAGISYDGAFVRNASGGLERGNGYIGNLHLRVAVDGKQLVNAPGVSAYADALWIHGTQPDDRIGDLQGVNNLAAPGGATLYEAWLQYNGQNSSILAGRYDLNTEFDRAHSATLFINSSLAIGAAFAKSGIAGPSIFPDPSVGVRVTLKPTEDIVWRTALLDGAPFERPGGPVGLFKGGDGLLVVSEAAFLTSEQSVRSGINPRSRIGRQSVSFPYEEKIAVGVWHYTTHLPDSSEMNPSGVPVEHAGSTGGYALFDRLLFDAGDRGKRGINGFLQLGIGDARVEPVAAYLGTGLVAHGLNADRPQDEFGLALARAYLASHYAVAQERVGIPVASAETAIELTYLTQINGNLAIQPDLQYVIHPHADRAIANATVLQLRFELSF